MVVAHWTHLVMTQMVTLWKVLVAETATVKRHLAFEKLLVVEKQLILEPKILVTMTDNAFPPKQEMKIFLLKHSKLLIYMKHLCVT